MLKNGEGSYVADQHTLDHARGGGPGRRALPRGNPNGSQRAIAGITNEAGNVVGLMPHPEHAVEDLCGPGTDGLGFFTSVRLGARSTPEPGHRASQRPPALGRARSAAQVASPTTFVALMPSCALVGADGVRRRGVVAAR